MTDHVWLSNAYMDTRIKLFVETDVNAANPENASKAQQLNNNGAPVPAELCPSKIWASEGAADYDQMPAGSMPELFYARGHWIVSEKAAAVLRQFDLGGGALYPLREGVFGKDQKARVAGEFFTWIFGNLKRTFLPDQTANKMPFGVAGLRWNLPWKLKDGDIAVSSAALIGPDVWLDDTLFDAIFLSQPLGDALVAAGLKRAFHLHKARVISVSEGI